MRALIVNWTQKLLGHMRVYGHPGIWFALIGVAMTAGVLDYRRYMETPSIPFYPVCHPDSDYLPYKPVKDIPMSREFQEAVIKTMIAKGMTIRAPKTSWFYADNQFLRKDASLPFILVAPKDWEYLNEMYGITVDAYNNLYHLGQACAGPVEGDFSDIKCGPPAVSLYCHEIEGKLEKF